MFEGQDEDYENMYFVDDRVLSELTTLTSANLFLIAGNNLKQCGSARMWSLMLH